MPEKWTKELDPEIISLYQQIADMTKPKCAACPQSYGCCHPMWCDLTRKFAEYCGVDLKPADNPVKWPLDKEDGAPMEFLSHETGCIVPPHLRPLCAVHVCEGHLLATCQDKCPPEFNDEYWALREKVNELDCDRLIGFSGQPFRMEILGFVEDGVAKPMPGGTISSKDIQRQLDEELKAQDDSNP